MKSSSEIAGGYDPEIDAALAVLGSVQPRAGLEQRVMTHLEMAPRLAWYKRLSLAPAGRHRWMLATASGVIVVGAMTVSGIHHRSLMTAPVPAVVRRQMPHPAQQPAAAAASIGVSDHPLESNIARTHRHRGIHRSARAVHQRVPLPPGTVAPLRPALSAAAH